MKKNIIVDIPFNIDLTPYLSAECKIIDKLSASFLKSQTEEWINKRMDLFMKYAASSLKRQNDQNFLCLVRYTPGTERFIRTALERYPALPNNICFTTYADKIIKDSLDKRGSLYRVVIDTDNMYVPSFIAQLQYLRPLSTTQTIMCQNGYIYDEKTGRLASIFHTSPSFYAAIYDRATYDALYEKRLFERHWDAIKYPYEVMEGRNYCIVVHEQNVDNDFEAIVNAFKGNLLSGGEKKRALLRLGLEKR